MSDSTDTDLISKEVQTYVEKFLKDFAFKTYTLDISAGSVRGDNYLGIIAKVHVNAEDQNDQSKTLNLIVKSAPRNELFRSFAPIRKAYDREIYIYDKVLPEFVKLQKERGLLYPFTSYAKFYRSTMEDLHEALIMEDMKQFGYMLLDRHKALDYDHVLLVLREYGKLHALSYAMRDQKSDVFKEMCDNTEEIYLNEFCESDTFQKSMQDQADRALNSLDPVKHRVAYEKFKKFHENMHETVRDLVKSGPAGKHAVIVHGDSWVNNILFKYGNSAKPHVPTNICVLDWQLACIGSPALDLSYFIFCCTDEELRAQHYNHFIQEYYNSLCSFLRQLGSDPEKLLPFKVLQEHLKKFSLYGLYMAIMALYFIMSETEEIPDIHSFVDVEDAVQKFNFESKNNEKYNKRMSSVILDFIKYGYDI